MPPIAIYRLPAVLEITGLSKATIYRLRQRGQFPQPIQLSPRCVGWRAKEVDAWLEARNAPDPVSGPLVKASRRANRGTVHTADRVLEEGTGPAAGKARVTVHLDREVAAVLGERAGDTGRAFQTVLNQALREYLAIKGLDAI